MGARSSAKAGAGSASITTPPPTGRSMRSAMHTVESAPATFSARPAMINTEPAELCGRVRYRSCRCDFRRRRGLWAVPVKDGRIVVLGPSRVVVNRDPTGHAETEALRDAARYLATHNLSSCEMLTRRRPAACAKPPTTGPIPGEFTVVPRRLTAANPTERRGRKFTALPALAYDSGTTRFRMPVPPFLLPSARCPVLAVRQALGSVAPVPFAAVAPQHHLGTQALGRDMKKDQLSKAGGGQAPLLKNNPMHYGYFTLKAGY